MNLQWLGKREEHRRLLKLKQLLDRPCEKLDDLLDYCTSNLEQLPVKTLDAYRFGSSRLFKTGGGFWRN